MKIATWNLERLKHIKKLSEINSFCRNLDADILVLTEYDERLNLDWYPFQISTKSLAELDSKYYRQTEKRVKIYSKSEISSHLETYDDFTSCCAKIKTDFGNLNVYGMILGIYGNRSENFNTDLPKQIADFKRFSENQNLCVIGDFNISFSDNYYFTNLGRNELNKSFAENRLQNLTESLLENIDHIAISKNFTQNTSFELSEWNIEKKLSDHKGVSVDLKMNFQ